MKRILLATAITVCLTAGPGAHAQMAVYDAANFQVLVDRYRTALGNNVPDYSI